MLSKKEIRAAFRDSVFVRDGHKCRVCGSDSTKLDAHHITDRSLCPNGGYVKENGISLCEPCHVKAERWHVSGHTEWEPGYHPDDLYRLIGSDHHKAMKASEKLSR